MCGGNRSVRVMSVSVMASVVCDTIDSSSSLKRNTRNTINTLNRGKLYNLYIHISSWLPLGFALYFLIILCIV